MYILHRPAITTGDTDKGPSETTAAVNSEQQAVDEQVVEKVAPLFSQPATIITIDTEACTHEVLCPVVDNLTCSTYLWQCFANCVYE